VDGSCPKQTVRARGGTAVEVGMTAGAWVRVKGMTVAAGLFTLQPTINTRKIGNPKRASRDRRKDSADIPENVFMIRLYNRRSFHKSERFGFLGIQVMEERLLPELSENYYFKPIALTGTLPDGTITPSPNN